MLAHPVVAAVSDRRRRSEIDATIYVSPYKLLVCAQHHDGDLPGQFPSNC
jgi:hypothetical protein